VFYRSGQTFVTWTELAYSGAFFNMTYNIYRHTEPITRLNLDAATLVGQVNQESSRNVARTEAHQRVDASYNTRHNYVIREGEAELSDDTGLFVYTCKTPGSFYYAVTSVKEGDENREDFSPGNALSLPIAEAVALPTAIVQNAFMNGTTLVQEYAHWADETMSYKIGHGFNFMVNVDDDYLADPETPVFLEIGLGGRSTRYYNTWVSNQGIYIRPDTYMPPTRYMPYDGYAYDGLQTWWSGCSTHYKTQVKLSEGVFVPYTENRILYYIDFVESLYTIDENRVYLRGGSMGGTGAISLGLKHPEVFASISSVVGSPNWRYNIQGVDESYRVTDLGWRAEGDRLWGLEAESPLHENGTPIWDWMDAGWYLLNYPDRETPFLETNNGKKDGSVMYFPLPQFYADIRQSRHGFAGRFYDGGHSGYGSAFTRRFGSIVKNESFPALNQVSIDDDPGGVHEPTGMALITDFTTSPVTFDGEPAGEINAYSEIEWSRTVRQFSSASHLDDMVDEAERYELALRLESDSPETSARADITPRRLQSFGILPGARYQWQNRRNSTGEIIQDGIVTADGYGLVTIPGFIIERADLGNKLILVAVGPQSRFDHDDDQDVDGSDLSDYINTALDFSDLPQFAEAFGWVE
jgi:pimeloyl-ACP methyl ester carboxylesterase